MLLVISPKDINILKTPKQVRLIAVTWNTHSSLLRAGRHIVCKLKVIFKPFGNLVRKHQPDLRISRTFFSFILFFFQNCLILCLVNYTCMTYYTNIIPVALLHVKRAKSSFIAQVITDWVTRKLLFLHRSQSNRLLVNLAVITVVCQQ